MLSKNPRCILHPMKVKNINLQFFLLLHPIKTAQIIGLTVQSRQKYIDGWKKLEKSTHNGKIFRTNHKIKCVME